MAINVIRTDHMPSLLDLKYFRYLDHVGVNEDFTDGFRPTPKPQERLSNDPVYRLRQKLLRSGYKNSVEEIEQQVDEQVLVSITKAREAPFPDKDKLTKGVYDGE